MEASDLSDWREWRRLRALPLKQQGWSQRDIGDALGVSEETVSRGLARARDGGPEALLARSSPGHPPKPSSAQKRLVPGSLGHGPEAYGSRGDVGTRARVARVIEEEFGVPYPKDQVARPLKEPRWAPQVPIKRALPRDAEAIERGRDAVGPELRRRARREHRTRVFEDESGSYLLPGVVRTYAPEGRTPVLREEQTRDPLSVLGGMTPEGKVDPLARQGSLNGRHSIESLVHLGHEAGDRLLVIWEGSPLPRRAEVTEFVSGTRGTVWREALPGYAPDLDPWDEGGWQHLKHGELRNRVGLDLERLHEGFPLAVGRLRQKPHLVRSFFAQAGLRIEKT